MIKIHVIKKDNKPVAVIMDYREYLRLNVSVYQIHHLHSDALCCNSTEVYLSLNSDRPPSQSNRNLFPVFFLCF